MDASIHINFLAVIVTAILNNVLAMIWYSPNVLGTKWAQEHGFALGDLKAGPLHFLGAFIVSLITAGVFALLISWFDISTLQGGLKAGAAFWLGFIATTHFSGVIWARKPLGAYAIDVGFQLLSMLMIGAILSTWR